MADHFMSFFYGFLTGSGLYALIRWIFFKDNSIKGELRKEKEDSNTNDKDDCFFFSPQGSILKCLNNPNFCNFLPCSACNYKKVANLISKAKTHLDVCVYLITKEELTDAVLQLSRKGIRVRIIIDRQMSDEANNSKVLVFIRNHIPIKVVDTSTIMHNKFVIIDQKKVLTGSFNWTNQGLFGNFESGVIIHNSTIVKKFIDYFQILWDTPFKSA